MSFEDLVISLLNRLNKPAQQQVPKGLRLGASEPNGSVVWPTGKQDQHLFVCGKTGAGKTTLLLGLAEQLMAAKAPFIFFDYHGDATQHLISLASRQNDAEEHLLLLDLTDPDTSPGLNPLEPLRKKGFEDAFARSSELATILRQRWQVDAFGARTEELLRNTLYTLAVNEYTLVEAPLLLTSDPFRSRLVERIDQPEIRDYWLERYEPLSEAMKGAFREPVLNKLTGFLTESSCRHFLGQRKSTFNFDEAIARGCWIIVNLAKGQLREHAHTLGNLIFARLQFDILARSAISEHRRRPVMVFADEAQNLAENNLDVLLTEGRKFKISLIVSCQHTRQLPPKLLGCLLAVGTHCFFQLSAADAASLSTELSVQLKSKFHRELTTLGRGQAIVRIGSDSPVFIHVTAPNKTPAAGIKSDRLTALSLSRYGRLRTEIEREIRQRRSTFTASREALSTPLSHDEDAGQREW